MKKISLIVAGIYMGLVVLTSFLFEPSFVKALFLIVAQLPIAAVLFLLIWGIGSLIRRQKH
jgi:hypothetical protein